MNFFETHQRELYKTWLIEEIGKNFGSTSPRSIQNSPVKKSHGNAASSILDEYLDDKSCNDVFLEFDVEKIDVIRQEVDAYLVEPLQSIDCFNYWSSKAEQWPRLCKLFREFNCAPVGSQESERLFSTAGAIMTDLRNRLSASNLEKLLFLHHNLPLLNFEY